MNGPVPVTLSLRVIGCGDDLGDFELAGVNKGVNKRGDRVQPNAALENSTPRVIAGECRV